MAMLAQGSKLYFIDPDTSAVVPVECATSFTPGGNPADQIETTCLEDTSRSYMPGLRTPAAASMGLNFDPTNPSHIRMFELSQRDPSPTLNWALGWSDGTDAPTADADGDFILPATRTFFTFQGYLSDVPFDFAANTVVTSTVAIQRSGPGVLVPKAAAA